LSDQFLFFLYRSQELKVLNNLKKIGYLTALSFLVCIGLTASASAQDRQRVVSNTSSQPVNQPQTIVRPKPLTSSAPLNAPPSRPTLTNSINVIKPVEKQLVKKTGSSSPVNSMKNAASRATYSMSVSSKIYAGIQDRMGIPYLYGSTGPNRYDCSGFVWSVFKDAGINFERASARTLWAESIPVFGDERFKFGTLIFLNNLGHMGIVADENGFYHASSSKGITYSPFKGYWEKRIVGFRRLPMQGESQPVIPSAMKTSASPE